MQLLFDHPDQRARLAADLDGLLPTAVEEMLRYTSPVVDFRRTAMEDTVIGDQPIAAGDKLMMFYGSGNRDEEVFADPDRFDVGRDPNPHMAFGGGGPHLCLGLHVARIEIAEMLRELLTRLPDLAPAGPREPLASNFISRGPHDAGAVHAGNSHRLIRAMRFVPAPTPNEPGSFRPRHRTNRDRPRHGGDATRVRGTVRSIEPLRRRGYGGAAEGIGPSRCPILGGSIMTNTLLPTTLVGSYAMPDWLIDREKLASRFPPRTRALELWRVAPEFLEEAQDDATLLAIRDQERAGLDIVTDGEMRRESYSNRFATALDGVDIDNPGTALDRRGHPNPVPRVVGPVRRRHPVEVRDVRVPAGQHRPADQDHRARARSPCRSRRRTTTTTHRASWRSTTPWRSTRRSRTCSPPAPTSCSSTSRTCRRARTRRGSTASRRSNRALDGVIGTTAVHMCFGYAAMIHERPEGYSFLPELGRATVDQISIETAQSEPRLLGARGAARQDDHPRRARPVDP